MLRKLQKSEERRAFGVVVLSPVSLLRMVSATLDLRLPSHPQNITALGGVAE